MRLVLFFSLTGGDSFFLPFFILLVTLSRASLSLDVCVCPLCSALGIDWLRDRVNEVKNYLSQNLSTILSKLSDLGQYVVRAASDFAAAVVQYAKPILEKILSGLEFFGTWAKRIGGNLIGGIKKVAGCLWTELDAHGTSGGSSVGLTLVAGLDLKLTPSLSVVCNRISCSYFLHVSWFHS